jgi:soluble lytic murein transglycosylase
LTVALVAYNAGPGNAGRWLEATGGDLDLFAETIPVEESRRFIRKIYEGYAIYKELYRSPTLGE